MTEHNLFYFPYASFTNAQLPLLKVAALYFDNLVLLDPVGAGWATIGVDYEVRRAIRMLSAENILKTVSPATVLAKYEAPIAAAIRQDMSDREFLQLCEDHSRVSGKQRWTLSLAKVPQDVQTDQAMRHLMGDFAREVARDSGKYREQVGENPSEYYEYAETGQAYDEYREGYDAGVEYRYADFPLALGEAIMMNHALFTGLLHAGATPLTDDSFHSQALSLKLRRALQDPGVRQARADRARQHKMDLLAVATLTDTQLKLPILNPKIPLEEVLAYRLAHKDGLQEARTKLGWMARSIQAEPWSKDFAQEIDHKTIPEINKQLEEVSKARYSWLESNRKRLVLDKVTIGLGAAAIGLTLFTTPFAPITLATAGLGISLSKDVVMPGAKWFLDWKDGKKTIQENGLHYLLKL